MKPKTIALYTVTLLLMCCSSLGFSREKIIFTCALAPDFPIKKLSHEIFTEAFDALGYDFDFRLSADLRSVVDAATGVTDGVCSRVYNYNEISGTPNLVRVESRVADITIEVWSRKPGVPMNNMDDLPANTSGSNLSKVGHKRGSVWIDDYLKTQPQAESIRVVDVGMGMKMLGGGRLDLFIGIGPLIGFAIDKYHLHDSVYLAGTLTTLALYPYLNVRHRELAVPLAEKLNRLIEERKFLTKSWQQQTE